MYTAKNFIPMAAALIISGFTYAQTPGSIFYGTSSILDPNSDGYITSNGNTLSATDELSQFEGFWKRVYQSSSEPSGDFAGGSCGFVDIVDATSTSQDAIYTGIYDPDGYPTNNDGDEYWVFRMRVAKDPGSSPFSYNVVIDLDNLFGNGTDPNYMVGNAGFEIEIILKSGSSAQIDVFDVDGTTSGTTVRSYTSPHYIRSYAAASICTKNPPVFLDWAIPFADLTADFGLGTNTQVRYAAGTGTSAGGSILSASSTKDYAGVDDNLYTEPVEQIITSQTETALPVELSSFFYTENNNKLLFNWTTQTELNNDYFIIQFSNNGTVYTDLSNKIQGMGTSISPTNYSTAINQIDIHSSGYFRLKQIDFDGTTSYSFILPYNKENNNASNFNINLLGQPINELQNGFNINIQNGRAIKSIVIVE